MVNIAFSAGMPHPKTTEAINHLQEQIADLRAQQSTALHDAVYTGMSRDQTALYDSRQESIAQLWRILARLQETP